ncbi:hypothetical protein AAHA92_13321 [Salvia divinorum]|uniref:Uncharacterized protein n=1 Tax=Salvia divinorum TaxID=28513 RepID=A0ABD1H7X4_SALDI
MIEARLLLPFFSAIQYLHHFCYLSNEEIIGFRQNSWGLKLNPRFSSKKAKSHLGFRAFSFPASFLCQIKIQVDFSELSS